MTSLGTYVNRETSKRESRRFYLIGHVVVSPWSLTWSIIMQVNTEDRSAEAAQHLEKAALLTARTHQVDIESVV